MSEELPEDMSIKKSKNMSERMSEDMSIDMSDNMSEKNIRQ